MLSVDQQDPPPRRTAGIPPAYIWVLRITACLDRGAKLVAFEGKLRQQGQRDGSKGSTDQHVPAATRRRSEVQLLRTQRRCQRGDSGSHCSSAALACLAALICLLCAAGGARVVLVGRSEQGQHVALQCRGEEGRGRGWEREEGGRVQHNCRVNNSTVSCHQACQPTCRLACVPGSPPDMHRWRSADSATVPPPASAAASWRLSCSSSGCKSTRPRRRSSSSERMIWAPISACRRLCAGTGAAARLPARPSPCARR